MTINKPIEPSIKKLVEPIFLGTRHQRHPTSLTAPNTSIDFEFQNVKTDHIKNKPNRPKNIDILQFLKNQTSDL